MMNTILVAVDFSDITEKLVDRAAAMARCLHASVYIIHVAAPDPDFIGYDVGPVHERQWRARELKGEKASLKQLAERLKQQGVDSTPMLVQGATAAKILEESQRLDASLLVMGTHGHGIALSALLGGTTLQVMKHVTCPVLLLPCRGTG